MEIKDFNVTLTLTEKMLGTVSSDPKVFSEFQAKDLENGVPEDEIETLPKDLEKGCTGFHKDEEGLIIYDQFIKGFFKSTANTIKDDLGIKNCRSKVVNHLFIFPRQIRVLTDTGENVMVADGTLERPLRAQTQQGPRVTLAKSEFVSEGRTLSFTVRIVGKKGIKLFTTEILEEILEYGKYIGLGQWRTGSCGRFEFILEEVK